MRRETWSLVGLEHAIGKTVLRGDVEIGLDRAIRIVDKLELGILRNHTAGKLADPHQVSAVHFSFVVLGYKSFVRMTQVVTSGQRSCRQRNLRALGINAEGGDIDPGLKVRIASK